MHADNNFQLQFTFSYCVIVNPTTMASSHKLELKLLIDKKSQKVLFAEAGKDAVDFLFSLFALPMGSVINLITKQSTIGSLGNMYSSWEQLDDAFFSSDKMKASNLIPAVSSSSTSPAALKEKVYRCSCCAYYSDAIGVQCQNCRNGMYTPMTYKGAKLTVEEVERNGYVKGGSIYAVMDDLSVVPLKAALAIISLVNKMGHRDLSLLEEKTVTLDVQAEGFGLLKTLWSKNVLTEVFLAKKKESNEK